MHAAAVRACLKPGRIRIVLPSSFDGTLASGGTLLVALGMGKARAGQKVNRSGRAKPGSGGGPASKSGLPDTTPPCFTKMVKLPKITIALCGLLGAYVGKQLAWTPPASVAALRARQESVHLRPAGAPFPRGRSSAVTGGARTSRTPGRSRGRSMLAAALA